MVCFTNSGIVIEEIMIQNDVKRSHVAPPKKENQIIDPLTSQ